MTLIADLMPTDIPAQIAWVDCLSWAVSEDSILDRFTADTGISYRPPRNAIERMIDEATGHTDEIAIAFVQWFNQNIWGEVNGRVCNGDEEILAEVRQ